jgi:uncharacterized protein YecE (DUF72 family)
MQILPDTHRLISRTLRSSTAKVVATVRIGTAAWSIPKEHAVPFPVAGSHLEHYAAVLNAVEINSSFYRPHRTATYERWAASVPEDFRSAVKIPKAITHERRLKHVDDLLNRFLSEAGGLGPKLGPLLVQLPPSLSFQDGIADRFLSDLRSRVPGSIVCEPRHPSWFTPEVETLLDQHRIARVAADPAPVPGADELGGWRGLSYYHLHGSPDLLLGLQRGASGSHRGGAHQGCRVRRRNLVHLRQHGGLRRDGERAHHPKPGDRRRSFSLVSGSSRPHLETAHAPLRGSEMV